MPPKAKETVQSKRNARRRANRQSKRQAHIEAREGTNFAVDRAVVRAGVNQALARRTADLKSASGLALSKMMMLPSESNPIRLPTPDMPAVSVAKLKSVKYYNELDTTHPEWHGYSYIALVYGQPGLNYMDGPYLYTESYTKHFHFYYHDDLTSAYNFGPNWVVEEMAGKQSPWNEDPGTWWPVVTMVNSDTRCPAYRPLLDHDSIRWAFFNRGEKLSWTALSASHVGTTIPAGSMRFGLYTLAGANEPLFETETTFTFTGSITPGAEITIPRTGWYAVKLLEATVTAGEILTISVRLNHGGVQNNPFWRLQYNEELGRYRSIAENSRRTAAALLVSNRTNQLKAQGTILAARLNAIMPGFKNWEYLDDEVSKAEGMYEGNAVKGVYTYMEFTNNDELFNDYVNQFGSPVCHLSSNMTNVITIGNSDTPNIYGVVYDTILEFRTYSQLFPKAVSNLANAELMHARRINNMTMYFYDNPLHWEDIKKYIQEMWAWTRKHSMLLGAAASTLAPEMAPVIMPAARLLQSP